MAIESISGYSSLGAGSIQSTTNNMNTNKRAEDIDVTTLGSGIANCPSATFASSQDAQGSAEAGEEKLSKEQQAEHLKSVLSVANQKIRLTNTRCEFVYHDKVNRVSIKVIDKQTDEVVREIPPEEALDVVEKMWELAGLIVDGKD